MLAVVLSAGCANFQVLTEEQKVMQGLQSAATEYFNGEYIQSLEILGNVEVYAKNQGITLPEGSKELRHAATARRLLDIEIEVTHAYHQGNVRWAMTLAKEAEALAVLDKTTVPERILQIKTKMQNGYFEQLFWGIPPHLEHRLINT